MQLLRYMVRIWEKEWRKRKQLSPLLPIVFYHGSEGWNYSRQFADLLAVPLPLQAYTPHFQHLLVDLSAYSDESLRGEIWLQVCLLVMKHIYDEDLGSRLPAIVGLLHELAHEESVMEMLQTVLLYATAVNSALSEADIRRGIRAVVAPERREMMEKTLAQKWLEEGFEQGKEEGKAEGREEGKEAQRRTLLHLLQWRFAISEQEQKRYSRYLAQIDQLDQLMQLVDRLLTTPTVADFESVLQRYLPKQTNQAES